MSKISESINSVSDKGGASDKDIDSIVPVIVNIAMWVVGVVSVLIIVFAGISYATAAGDEAKVKKAKNMLVGGIVGLVIAILAGVIVGYVTTYL